MAKENVAKPESPKEDKFEINALRRDSLKLFGVTRSTFDGAFYGKTGDFSISEAKELIKDFQNRRVN